jgi:hypothetical protein
MPDIRSLEERGYDSDYRSVNTFAEAKKAEADKNVPNATQYTILTPIKMINDLPIVGSLIGREFSLPN